MDFLETTLLLFYTDCCPHAKRAKRVLEKIMTAGYAIDFVEYNCSDNYTALNKLQDKYYIFGSPTIVLIKDNQEIKYHGYIIETEVTKWLDSLDVPYYEPPVMK